LHQVEACQRTFQLASNALAHETEYTMDSTPWFADRYRTTGATLVLLSLLFGTLAGCGPASETSPSGAKRQLTNVSYDPTRELYAEFNEAFARHWQATHGQAVEFAQSHGGSGKQARAVIEGLDADVVSLALSGDIDAIAEKTNALPTAWQQNFPNNSSPYTSTIVFLVRKGNPKSVGDWGDLVRDDIEVITPNPKTGGGARWNYLAAWGYALSTQLGDLKKIQDPKESAAVAQATEHAKDFISKLYANVPVLDTSARAATNTFIQRGIGDVLITWENEAYLALREAGTDQVELVVPSMSILTEPPVAVVERNASGHNNLDLAKAYVEYLYSDEGQQIIAKHFYRPRRKEVVSQEDLKRFTELKLFELSDIVSNWKDAQETHFKDRTGVFDQVYSSKAQ
jgi:sulfate transport system substrate-binding protein